MDREIAIQNYLPPVVREIREFKVLTEAENPEFQKLLEVLGQVMDNQFILTATDYGLSRWERMLKIIPPRDSTFPQRRAAILAKLRAQTPFNLDALRQVVETYLGVPVDIYLWWNKDERIWSELEADFDSWGDLEPFKWEAFCRDMEPYTILIYYKGTEVAPDLSPLERLIYEIIPANLIVKILFIYLTWEEVEQRYPAWGDLEGTTWERIEMGV